MQAACGLEYVHSLGIVHSDLNPVSTERAFGLSHAPTYFFVQGNVLVDDDGTARLGDFGITAIITDPSVVEPGSTTTSKPGVVRYMAPELLNPTQFNLANKNPTKESDVYSFALTTYEVGSPRTTYGHLQSSDQRSTPPPTERPLARGPDMGHDHYMLE